MEGTVLLNSMARAFFNPKTGEYFLKDKLATSASVDAANMKVVSKKFDANAFTETSLGVGAYQGMMSSI